MYPHALEPNRLHHLHRPTRTSAAPASPEPPSGVAANDSTWPSRSDAVEWIELPQDGSEGQSRDAPETW